MWPVLREWGGEDAVNQPLDSPPTGGLRREIEDAMSYNKYNKAEPHAKLQAFIDRLGRATVLDPACGSGNFLYVALEKLIALEHEAIKLGLAWELPPLERKVHPRQLFGIEKNEYAHQLASTVVWIGYLQSKRKRGDYSVDDPVLEPLDNIQCRDAILDLTNPADPKEPEWPESEFIVGNPPFLGGKLLIGELGAPYVAAQRRLYRDRVLPFGDLCCYWLEKARSSVARHRAARAGLLATQSVRGGASRATIQRIKEAGGLFFAESDRPWILDGALVNISMLGFDSGEEKRIVLNGRSVEGIHANLTAEHDTSLAATLKENSRIGFIGTQKNGPFDIDRAFAERLLAQPNPDSRSNSRVIRRTCNGADVLGRPSDTWIIDFAQMPQNEAALYADPFECVKQRVAPMRQGVRRKAHRERWWQFGDSRPGMRQALSSLPRFVVTPTLSKHRIFKWLSGDVLPDHQLVAFARADDYFFGVLHSHAHEVWALHLGTQLQARPRYTPTTCFETFPLPWSPGKEPVDDPRYVVISEAARELNELRERALNPDPLPEPEELKKLTLTNLYNRMKAGELSWLANAHENLDRAVYAAYGWAYPLEDQEILSRLLAENLRRAAAGS